MGVVAVLNLCGNRDLVKGILFSVMQYEWSSFADVIGLLGESVPSYFS